jgi:excinuclease ABC subunit C
VGKAKDLKKRVSSYFKNKKLDPKTKLLVKEINSIEHIAVGSEIESFLLEAEIIKRNKPYFNIKFTDDKSYPYIIVSKDKIPYVSITRKKNIKKAECFGPYPDADSVRTVLRVLRRIFPFQSVKNHTKRKCLYYHLGLCPCVPAVPSNLTQYKRNISNLKKFLKGKKDNVVRSLESGKKLLVKTENFEDARIIQGQIDAVNKITAETFDPFYFLEKPQAQLEREKKENNELRKILEDKGINFERLERIECYDISNFQGSEATGSMTVFINGSAEKSQYRKFKIKKVKGINDFAMHQEVMSRRLKHLEDWGKPDLLIIDGGKGQVGSVMAVLTHLYIQIPVIGLAKRFETIIVPVKQGETLMQGGTLIFKEVKLPISSSALNLVRRIRDEAHRFAVTYHKTLRSKKTFT